LEVTVHAAVAAGLMLTITVCVLVTIDPLQP
jgi:hypothetical protein